MKRTFGNLARPYRVLEHLVFGKILEHSRNEYIENILPAKSILLLGDGDGRFVKALQDRNYKGKITVIEKSQKMIATSKAKTTDITYHQADARTHPFETYDAIVCHYFLDCFTQTDANHLIQKITQSLNPNGILILTDFFIPKRSTAFLPAKFATAFLYLGFRLTTDIESKRLPDLKALFDSKFLNVVHQRNRLGGWIRSYSFQKQNPES